MRRFKFIDARIVLFQAIEKDVSRVRISMKEIVDENLFNEACARSDRLKADERPVF